MTSKTAPLKNSITSKVKFLQNTGTHFYPYTILVFLSFHTIVSLSILAVSDISITLGFVILLPAFWYGYALNNSVTGSRKRKFIRELSDEMANLEQEVNQEFISDEDFEEKENPDYQKAYLTYKNKLFDRICEKLDYSPEQKEAVI